jgi:hypothetical protein
MVFARARISLKAGDSNSNTKVRRGYRREDGLSSGCPETGVLWGELVDLVFVQFQYCDKKAQKIINSHLDEVQYLI